MRGYFVTGTDTGVGKTVVAAALAARPGFRYWKPIQTGTSIDDDTAEVRRLAGCEVLDEGVRLPDPVSPHLAAKRAGMRIDLEDLLRLPTTATGAAELLDPLAEPRPQGAVSPPSEISWIVEGAGGVLVPINESETMVDLMVALALPVVVAARTTLGTINHTLLTLALLRTAGLEAAAVVMVGEPNADNRAAVERYGHVEVHEMPWFDPLTPEAVRGWRW